MYAAHHFFLWRRSLPGVSVLDAVRSTLVHTPPPPVADGSDAFDDEVRQVLAGLGVSPGGTVDLPAFVAAVSQLVRCLRVRVSSSQVLSRAG